MGAGSSRDAAGSRKARSCSGSRRVKGKPSVKDRFLGSACLRSRQVFSDEEDCEEVPDDLGGNCCSCFIYIVKPNEGDGSRMKVKPCTVELGQSSLNHPDGVKLPQVNLALANMTRLGEDNGENTSPMELVSDRSSASGSAKTSKSSVRFRSRFSLFHRGSVFRVSSSASGGSSDTRPIFSRSLSTPCAEEVNHANMIEDVASNNIYDPHQQSITDAASSASRAVSNTNPIDGVGHYSQMNLALSEILGVGHSQRSQEPSEGTARFSRSRSVGRLRNRVLRRSLLSEVGSTVITSTDEAQGYVHQGSRMQHLSGAENVSSINENVGTPVSSINHLSSMSRSIENNHNPDSEATTSRDNETLEYRLAYLERMRRIRYQVRGLQRLSTRFESLSGHERSCILSGQHRSGCCSCTTPGRSINPDEDTSTRATVSRIVMLAEALFEVLDEIHQQAVVLASRPSLSSIGAVPAPKEVVDCMTVKLFAMPRKCPSDGAAQCYICLVEYEEGDSIRILPCCHEFHQACVDKWLKEVHRVCPLCRGDVCISELTSAEGHESSSS